MTSKIIVNNIQSDAGVSTVFFNSDIGGTGGTLNVDGNLNVGGVVTYDDVTNIDSVGVITARSDVSIADKIVHTGDTDTAIRFPGADQVSVETGGTQRLLIGSDGKLVHSTSAAETVDFGTSNSSGSYHKYDLGSSGATIGYIGAGSQIVSGSNVADFGVRSQANLVFSSGGDTERLRISSDGRIGIGMVPHTSSTGYALQIDGGASSFIQIFNDTSGNTINDGLVIGNDANTAYLVNKENTPLIFRTNNTEQLRLDSNGYLGLNNAAPHNQYYNNLVIGDGSASGDKGITIRTQSSNEGVIAFSDADSGAARYAGKIAYNHGTNAMMFFTTNGDERVRIDSAGRLLHGTTSSSANISAVFQGNSDNSASAAGILLQRGTATPPDGQELGNIYFADSAAGTGAIILGKRDGGTWSGSSKPGRIEFWTTPNGATSGNERVRITSGGLLQIGTSTTSSFPDRLLSVGHHTRASSYVDIRSSTIGGLLFADGTSGDAAYRGQVDYAHSTDELRLWTAAAIRVKVSSAGRIRFPNVPGVAGSNLSTLYIESDGNLCTTTSVRAAKTNISPLDDTSWLYNLNPVTFNWRTKTENEDGTLNWGEEADGGIQYGLIAEEVKEVKDDFCYYNNDGVLTGIHYDRLIAPLLKVVQQQKEEIETLKARITALEGT